MGSDHAVIDAPCKPAARGEGPAQAGFLSVGSPLAASLLAALLFWAALPPVGAWPLAWLALVPLVALAQRPRLAGTRPYLQIWLGGFVFWLAAIYWLTLPHPATSLGWVALSFYLALYWPAFVGLLRVAIHRLGASALVAAPLVYLGLELAREHLLTGFMLTGLGHSQYRWTTLAQIADLAGVSGISAFVLFVAACLERLVPRPDRPRALSPLLAVALGFGLVLGYGHWRLGQKVQSPGPTVALIQGSIDITMKMDAGQNDEIFRQYIELSREAVDREPRLDLVVWPETMFRYPWFTFGEGFEPPPGTTWTVEQAKASSLAAIRDVTGWLEVPILLGIDTVHQTSAGVERYNSALLVEPGQRPGTRYDKVHRVMFGEYVPLAETFPWLYQLTPLPGGLNRGRGPASIEVGGTRYAPNICFESTVEHLIRGQVTELAARGEEPDVLVNLTNDGWFWGSSELEMHLACEVLRAIECRKPFLVAANTGISAWIDSSGRVLAQGPRRTTDVIIARTELDSRRSPYLAIGDIPAGICLVLCVGLAILGWKGRRDAR